MVKNKLMVPNLKTQQLQIFWVFFRHNMETFTEPFYQILDFTGVITIKEAGQAINIYRCWQMVVGRYFVGWNTDCGAKMMALVGKWRQGGVGGGYTWSIDA